jgi:periplasmic protein TonB
MRASRQRSSARAENDADPPGAIAVELAPITAAVPFASNEVPLEPMMRDEAAVPETRKQIAEKVAEVVARVAPAPLAPEPTVQVPDPQPEQKSQQALAASMTSVPPRADAKIADAAVAPAGLSAIAAKTQAAWQKLLFAHINRYKRYPAAASAHKMTGIVTVDFMLDRRGQVLSTRVTQSSGAAMLDEEALGLLRRAAPLPVPPQDVPAEGILLTVPIQFRMD